MRKVFRSLVKNVGLRGITVLAAALVTASGLTTAVVFADTTSDNGDVTTSCDSIPASSSTSCHFVFTNNAGELLKSVSFEISDYGVLPVSTSNIEPVGCSRYHATSGDNGLGWCVIDSTIPAGSSAEFDVTIDSDNGANAPILIHGWSTQAQNPDSDGNDQGDTLYLPIVVPPAPAVPTNLVATSPAQTPVLNWDPVLGANSYNIYRDSSPTPISTGITGTSYTDNDVTPGSHIYYVTAVNAGGESGQSNSVTVLVVSSAPTFTSTASDTESYGVPFSFNVTTTGNPTPTISKTGGLPPGVTFTKNGDGTATIAGTPSGSANGTYAITIKGSNEFGTATQDFVLTINRAPSITTIQNKNIDAGSPYSLTIKTKGYNYPTITESDTLPNGLMLTDNGDGTATISGTPAVGSGGQYPITIMASNQFGTDTQTFNINVDEAPVITSADNTSVAVGTALSFQVTSTGFPAPNYSITGTLPAGVTFHTGTGILSGTPKAGTAGTYPVTITATNSTGAVSQSFTLTVT